MKSLAVLAAGMVTPLGFNAPATLAALRAGVSAVGMIPWRDPQSGEPLRGAKVDLPQWWEGVGKLADLVAPAIHECIQSAQPMSPNAIPLLLGVAEADRPARTQGCEAQLLEEIEARLEFALHSDSVAFAGGQTACAHALLRAEALIASGKAPMCIVAGVDSYLQKPTVEAYASKRRLMTPDNSNGFFPGEAGSAVLVTSAAAAAGNSCLRILGYGSAQEHATIDSTLPLKAVGLTQAIKQALAEAGLGMGRVNYRLTDLTGEHYKFKEAAFAANRLDKQKRAGALELWHPVEYLGEIGAAILPCLLGWALHACRMGYAPGPTALCHVGNDGGERCALVVSCS